jgi:two-component system, response regulator
MSQRLVLMVEDDAMDVELMLAAMADVAPTARVEVATTAEDAWVFLDELRAKQASQDVAMILLDLKLPGMSGLELLRRIRMTASFRRLPVVILTSSLEPADIATCYDAGANSYLAKPGSFGELLELAERIQCYWLGYNRRPPGGVA